MRVGLVVRFGSRDSRIMNLAFLIASLQARKSVTDFLGGEEGSAHPSINQTSPATTPTATSMQNPSPKARA